MEQWTAPEGEWKLYILYLSRNQEYHLCFFRFEKPGDQ